MKESFLPANFSKDGLVRGFQDGQLALRSMAEEVISWTEMDAWSLAIGICIGAVGIVLVLVCLPDMGEWADRWEEGETSLTPMEQEWDAPTGEEGWPRSRWQWRESRYWLEEENGEDLGGWPQWR